MIMQISDYKRIDPAFESVYRTFSAANLQESCERSWANLLLYMATYDWHAWVSDDRLWIASFKENYIFFPLGKVIEPEALKVVLGEFALLCGGDFVCGDVPEDYLALYPHAAELMTFENDPGEADYIYSLEHLQSFSGSKLRKRHNQLRQFDREYENRWFCREIKAGDLAEIRSLAEKLSQTYWSDDTGLEERLAFDRLPEVWNLPSVGLSGIVLYVDDHIAGFSIYSPLTDNMVDVHIEKADHAYRGCGAKLTSELVNTLLRKGFCYMNREQDLNLDGLRRAKCALDPDHLFERLSISTLK